MHVPQTQKNRLPVISRGAMTVADSGDVNNL